MAGATPRITVFYFTASNCTAASLHMSTAWLDQVGCTAAISSFNNGSLPTVHYIEVPQLFSANSSYSLFNQTFSDALCTGFQAGSNPNFTVTPSVCTPVSNQTSVIVLQSPVGLAAANSTPPALNLDYAKLGPSLLLNQTTPVNISTQSTTVFPTPVPTTSAQFAGTIAVMSTTSIKFNVSEIFWNTQDIGPSLRLVSFDLVSNSHDSLTFEFLLANPSGSGHSRRAKRAMGVADHNAPNAGNNSTFLSNVSFALSRDNDNSFLLAVDIGSHVVAWASFTADMSGNQSNARAFFATSTLPNPLDLELDLTSSSSPPSQPTIPLPPVISPSPSNETTPSSPPSESVTPSAASIVTPVAYTLTLIILAVLF